MHVKFKPGTTLDGKTPNECAKEGLYLTNPNALSPRWFAISSYIKTFNFVRGAELGVSKGDNFKSLLEMNSSPVERPSPLIEGRTYNTCL